MLYNDSWHVVLLAVESVRIEKKVSFFVATHFVAKQSHTHLPLSLLSEHEAIHTTTET
jgi:hypothetical protein